MSNMTTGTAHSTNSLLGLIRMNDRNLTDWEVSDVLAPTQFEEALPWFGASNGTQHKWSVFTSLPGASFRLVNNGIANAAGQEKTMTADLKLIDAGWDADRALVNENVKGGRDGYIMKRGLWSLNAALVKAEYSLIQGYNYDNSGPDGLQDLASLYGLAYNAGGAGGKRVYMMITGEADVCGILGMGGRFDVGAPVEAYRTTNTSTNAGYDIIRQAILGWMALQVGGRYSLAVGYNFDGTAGHLVTDSALAKIFKQFPSDRKPRVNLILMSATALEELQSSRTATTPTGAYADYPMAWNGAGHPIPIVVSDALSDSESTVTTTTGTTTTTTAEA